VIEFCTCGSIKLQDSCSNKKCEHHIEGTEYATYKQCEYIKDMLVKLNDETSHNYRNMTLKDAGRIINELEQRVEYEM
jgi:hypothetical protein